MEKSEMGKSGDAFIDRSKVRILLCDNDERSSEDAFRLLSKCSYQVTSVKSPRQVIDALNAEGPDIDIILSEVDLPMSKGMKMLKYIMRDRDLRRIPVIMMSAQDEVDVVVKCLKLGAADYLVKPLRTNELLNLWTHMWRRRRMLGLAEKNIINYDLDLFVSDPSDATTSTNLFSDDTEDKSRKSINLETCVSTHPEKETTNATAAAEPILHTACGAPSDCQPNVPELIDRQRGQLLKKSELKIGESSAFFTYVKSTTPESNIHRPSSLNENPPQHQKAPLENLALMNGQMSSDTRMENYTQAADVRTINNSIPNSFSVERFSTPPISIENSQKQRQNSNEEFSQPHIHSAYPYYMPGLMNQLAMQQSPNMMNHANTNTSPIMPQYNLVQHFPPHVSGMPPYPYYPFGMCLQPGQMPTPHQQWPLLGNPSNEGEGVVKLLDRREAALMKFRQKRKERCFDKKIRYANRKKLAERRPRLKGQFARTMNGVDVDLNGQQPASAEYDEELEEDFDAED